MEGRGISWELAARRGGLLQARSREATPCEKQPLSDHQTNFPSWDRPP